jgi:hypothetical protein
MKVEKHQISVVFVNLSHYMKLKGWDTSKSHKQIPKFQKVWDRIPKSHKQVPKFQKDWDLEA